MFDNDLEYGECGENKCLMELIASPFTKSVVDVRNDKFFQKIDVDFLQVREDKIVKIEVKSDRKSHISGNLIYETKSNSNEGCLARSEADIVYYYESETDTTYYINLKWLKKYLSITPYKEVSMGDGAKGYLISISELERENIARRKK